MRNRARGHNVKNSMSKLPEMARYLALFEQCRTTQMFSLEGTKGSGKQQMRTIKVVQMPTGYSVLPYEGGVMDQPYRMMAYFDIFFHVERDEAFKNLSK